MNDVAHPNVILPEGVEGAIEKKYELQPPWGPQFYPEMIVRMGPTTLGNLVWDTYCSGSYVEEYVIIDGWRRTCKSD